MKKSLPLFLAFFICQSSAHAGQVFLNCTFVDSQGKTQSEEISLDPETNEAYITTAIYFGNPQVKAEPLISSEKYRLNFEYNGKGYAYVINRSDGSYEAFEPRRLNARLGYLSMDREVIHHKGKCLKKSKKDIPKQLF